MRDYVMKWQNNPEGMPIAEIPTWKLQGMLNFLIRGGVTDWEGEDPAGVIKRIRLELEIRVHGPK
jgi:hypothetical protein